MSEKADVTFQMTVEDLEFLVFAMKFLEGGISEETLRGYWQTAKRVQRKSKKFFTLKIFGISHTMIPDRETEMPDRPSRRDTGNVRCR